MSLYTVAGAKFFVSTGLEAAKTISAMSNASPAVATATAHGYVDNDEVLISSGWEDADQSIFRINQLTTDTFELTGFDATNTDWYPAGSGTGTAKEISGWLELGQVIAVQSQGGGPRNITTNLLNRRNPVVTPVGFEASTLQFTLGYDPALADQVALLAASRVLAKRAFKFVLPGSAYAYCYGTVAMSNIPQMDSQSVLSRQVTVGIDGLFTQF